MITTATLLFTGVKNWVDQLAASVNFIKHSEQGGRTPLKNKITINRVKRGKTGRTGGARRH